MIYLTVICGLQLVALAGVVVLAFRERERTDRLMVEREAEWGRERRELLTRIQRPELVPIPKQNATPAQRRAIDDISKVGKVAAVPIVRGVNDLGHPSVIPDLGARGVEGTD